MKYLKQQFFIDLHLHATNNKMNRNFAGVRSNI